MGSAWGKIIFTPWLDFTSTNTWSNFYSGLNTIADRRTVSGGFGQPAANNVKGRLDINSTTNNSFLTSNIMSFRKTFNKNHSVNAIAGQEYQYKQLLTTVITKTDMLAGERNPSAGASDNSGTFHNMATGIEKEYLVSSLFSQADYSYNEKYLFSGSLRRDGSASFAKESRYMTFWSLSGGWTMSKENFWDPMREVVSFLKFRGSYGISGKDAGADFLNQTLYTRTGNNPASDYLEKGNQGFYMSQLGNTSLTWETTYITEAGVDLELYKGRVSANFSIYNRAGKNLLLRSQYSSISGIPAQYQNIGDMTNKGWELMLKSINIQTKDFTWTTTFNGFHNTNKIVAIRPPVSNTDVPLLPVSSTAFTYGYSGSYTVGESLNDIKVVKFLRFDKDLGYPVFEHVSDEDGSKSVVMITPTSSFNNLLGNMASQQRIGSSAPKIQGGFINDFRYKNFGLGIMITYSFGTMVANRAVNQTTMNMYGTSWTATNPLVYDKNHIYWKPGSPDNDKANTAGPGFQFPSVQLQSTSLGWISGDAVKLANIRLSYDLPATTLEKLKISSFQIVLSADNLYYFTNKLYVGADPESVVYQGSGNDTGGFGRSNYSYGFVAAPKRINLAFNLGF